MHPDPRLLIKVKSKEKTVRRTVLATQDGAISVSFLGREKSSMTLT